MRFARCGSCNIVFISRISQRILIQDRLVTPEDPDIDYSVVDQYPILLNDQEGGLLFRYALHHCSNSNSVVLHLYQHNCSYIRFEKNLNDYTIIKPDKQYFLDLGGDPLQALSWGTRNTDLDNFEEGKSNISVAFYSSFRLISRRRMTSFGVLPEFWNQVRLYELILTQA